RSIDGGDSYDEVSIIDEAETYVGPYITEDSSGNLYVAWTTFDGVGGNLLLSKSLDDGDTFSQPEMINDDGNYSLLTAAQGRPAKSTLPVLRFDETDRLYVLWADVYDQVDHSFDVYLRYSDDFGDSWSPRTQVNPETSGNQWNPEMVIDSTGRIHIAYYDEQGATYRPYYRTVNFTGTDRSTALFSDAIPIANADTLSDFSRPGEYLGLQIDSEMKPHVVWSDARNGEMDIYYAHGLFQEPSSPSMNYELLVAVVVIIALVILVAMCFIKKR
ncbi:MAG: sialidase family protein, partial [Candidatus Hodarchaeota archaeon]